MARRDVDAVIGCYRPRSISQEAAAFARQVVEAAGPPRPERAKALLFAAGRLADFGQRVGLELDMKLLLSDSLIERFCTACPVGTTATQRTLRANLRFLARHGFAGRPPAPAPLARDRAKAPYSAAEVASYLALADTQATRLRRERSAALICLGAGAGLIGGELRGVRGHDVVCRSGGVLVEVVGRRPRAVPVLASYQERLCGSARFFGSSYLVSGADPDSHNVTNPLLRSLSGGADLPRLETARLRSSYLVALARQIGLKAFMDAAGITCSQRLGDLVSHLEPLAEEATVTLLGGRR